MGEHRSQIAKGAAISYIAIFINIAAALLYTPWMVSQIGKANYGLYTLALSLISLFSIDFGIGAAVPRFLAKYRAEGDEQSANRIMGIVFRLYLLIDLAICVALAVVFFFLENIYVGLSAQEMETFKLIYLIAGFFSLFSFPFSSLNGILTAYERFVPLKLLDMLQKLLSIALIVAALALRLGVAAMVLANAVSGIVIILVKLLYIRARVPIRPDFRYKSGGMVRTIFSFSIWVTVISLAQRCVFNVAPSILGIVSDSTQIAIFSPAMAIEGYFYMVAAAINGLFLPTISRLIADREEDKLLPLMIRVGRFQVMLLGLVFAGFVVQGREMMVLWMGEAFVPSYYAALFLLLPDLLIFSQQIANSVVLAKNEVRRQALIYVGMAAISLTASFLLSRAYGGIGACAAICIAYCFNFVAMNVLFKRRLGLDVRRFFRECYGPAIVPIGGTIALGLLLVRRIPGAGWGAFLLRCVCVGAVFLLLAYGFFLSRAEKERAGAFVRGRLGRRR